MILNLVSKSNVLLSFQVGSKNGKSKTVCTNYCNTDACNKTWQLHGRHKLFLVPPIAVLLIANLIHY